MLANINEVTTLMATALAQNDYLCQEALKCYQVCCPKATLPTMTLIHSVMGQLFPQSLR